MRACAIRWVALSAALVVLPVSNSALAQDAEADRERDAVQQNEEDAGAAEQEAVVVSEPMPRPETLQFHLTDGSIVTGKLAQQELVVETRFGTLTVPVDSLDGLVPGMGSHPELRREIGQLIRDLGDDDFSKRELAQKRLLDMGELVRTRLEEHRSDPDTERRKRIEHILSKMDEAEFDPDEEADPHVKPLIDEDTIITTDFTIVGEVPQQEFTIQSLYGPLQVKLSDIRRAVRPLAEPAELQKSCDVDGTHLAFQSLYNTKLRIERGDQVTIKAGGTITMTPWGNNAVSTPDGAANYGWFLQNEIPTGALIARLGPAGPLFKIGSRHAFTAERGGILYLGIAVPPNFAQQQFPGKYDVNIRVRRK